VTQNEVVFYQEKHFFAFDVVLLLIVQIHGCEFHKVLRTLELKQVHVYVDPPYFYQILHIFVGLSEKLVVLILDGSGSKIVVFQIL